MDLESGRPSPESMGKDDVTSAALLPNSDDVNKTETNGSCAHDICDLNSDGDAYEIPELDESANHAEEFGKLNSAEQADVKSRADCGSEKSNHLNSGEDVDALILGSSKIREIHDCRPLDFPSSPASTSGGVPESSPLIATKGYGLKKWRRIKREFTKDGSPNLDSNKMLKRGLPCPVNFVDPSALPADMNPKSEAEASVSSTNALANSVGGADDFAIPGSNSVYRLESGSMFSAGTDSDNSEDRNSKSSTAASAPKSRYSMPKAIGYPREKYRMKYQSGRNLGNAEQLLQQSKGQVDTSKKPRAVNNLKIDKENSVSSMESDSRSSNSVMWGTPSVHNDVGKCERPIDYNGKQSHESHDLSTGEQQSVEEILTGPSRNAGGVEDVSPDDAQSPREIKEELRKNHQPSRGWDPLVASVLKLQSVRDALEKEIHKFGEIGKDLHLLCDDSSKSSLVVKQLEEVRCILEEKVSQIVEPEATIDQRKLPKELGETIELQQRCQEVDEELEGLLMQRIEAEVEHLAITRATENWSKILVDYQMKLLEERRSLAEEQVQTPIKTGDVEIKAAVLKGQAEESGTYCREISRKRVVKYTSCFLVQFIFLVLVLELRFLHLLPDSSVVMPT